MHSQKHRTLSCEFPGEFPGNMRSVMERVTPKHWFFLWIFQGHMSGWRFGQQCRLPSWVQAWVLVQAPPSWVRSFWGLGACLRSGIHHIGTLSFTLLNFKMNPKKGRGFDQLVPVGPQHVV